MAKRGVTHIEAHERAYRLLRMQDYCVDTLQMLDFEATLHSSPAIENLRTQWRLAHGAVSDLRHMLAADTTQDIGNLTHCVLWFMTVHSQPLKELKNRPMPEPDAPEPPYIAPAPCKPPPDRHRSARHNPHSLRVALDRSRLLHERTRTRCEEAKHLVDTTRQLRDQVCKQRAELQDRHARIASVR